MSADLLIKNAWLILPHGTVEGGVAVDNGKIDAVISGTSLPKADRVIDAEGKYILPGMIDAHVHFREPGAASKEGWVTGSMAAAAGGVTTVLDMPNTQPPTTSQEELNKKREIAASKALVDYGFHFAATSENKAEITKLERNIASVKFYTCSTVGSLVINNDAVIYEDFQILSNKELLSTTHAENQVMVDYWTERFKESGETDPLKYAQARRNLCSADKLNSMIYLSKIAGNRLHICHISTKEEADLLRKSKNKRLTAEVSPRHLFLSTDNIKSLGTYSKVNPPLRSKTDQAVLWSALLDGTIDIIGSDHAPHLRESKERDIFSASAGFPELETTLPLLLNETHDGRLTLEMIAKITSEKPAQIFRIKNKGRIEKGFDADLVMVDLDKKEKVREDKLFTKCGWSPYSGMKLRGWPVKTFVRGNLVFNDGVIHEEHKGREVKYY